jgi:flagellar biosynthesis GTPase FlhF
MKLNKYLTVGVIIVAVAVIIALSQPLRENMAGPTDIEYVSQSTTDGAVMLTGGTGTKITEISFAGWGTPTFINGQPDRSKCYQSIKSNVESNCLNKEHCVVDSTRIGGDPCSGVGKHVLIVYKATKQSTSLTGNAANTYSMIHGERGLWDGRHDPKSTMGAFAAPGIPTKNPRITGVQFGTYGTTSIDSSGKVVRQDWCHRNLTDDADTSCSNKAFCRLPLYNEHWGNPCGNHYKAVTLTFTTTPPVSVLSLKADEEKAAADKAAKDVADKAAADKAAADKAAKDAADKAAKDAKDAADKAAKDAADKAASDAAKAVADKAAKDAADKAAKEAAAIAADTKLSDEQKAAATKAAEDKAAAEKAAAVLKAGIAADSKMTAADKAVAIKAIDDKLAADKAAADKLVAEKTAVFKDKIFGIEFKDENQANMAYAGGGIALLLVVGGILMFAFSSPAPPAYGARRRRRR